MENVLQRHLHWRVSLLGDPRSMLQDSLASIWYCLRVVSLFLLCKLHCRYVFENEVNSVSAFYHIWGKEVCMKLLTKGALFVNDAKHLDPSSYFDFIIFLVAIRKRL